LSSQLSLNDYNNFKEFLEKHCGLMLGDNKHYLVSSRLTGLLGEFNVPTVGDLIQKIVGRPDTRLRERVIEAMTTNETFWFRDGFPFDILKSTIFPEFDSKLGGIKIWSSACSSGQEAYSISMATEEYRAEKPGRMRGEVRIVGTDISAAIVRAAQKGCYDNLAMTRGLSPERKKKFFRQADECWQVNDNIKARASFREMNLLQSYSLLGKFDIVFCRNVLIYFSPENKRDIIERIRQTLNPRGFLFLGASESLSNYSDAFEMIRCNPGVLYRLKQ
jgi:chemotaxis protein methyltransferase CheR